jgi:hypothetical protein
MMLCIRTRVAIFSALLLACARTEQIADSEDVREIGVATKNFLTAAARGDTSSMSTVAADSVVRMYAFGNEINHSMLQAAAASLQIDKVEARDNIAHAAFTYVLGGKPMYGTAVAERKGNTWKLMRVSILVEY